MYFAAFQCVVALLIHPHMTTFIPFQNLKCSAFLLECRAICPSSITVGSLCVYECVSLLTHLTYGVSVCPLTLSRTHRAMKVKKLWGFA